MLVLSLSCEVIVLVQGNHPSSNDSVLSVFEIQTWGQWHFCGDGLFDRSIMRRKNINCVLERPTISFRGTDRNVYEVIVC